MSENKGTCVIEDHFVPDKYLVRVRSILVCFNCIRNKTNTELLNRVQQIWNTLPAKKVCPRCQEKKLAEEFGIRTSFGHFHLHSYCRICQRKINSEWYQHNKAKRAEYMREYRKRRR